MAATGTLRVRRNNLFAQSSTLCLDDVRIGARLRTDGLGVVTVACGERKMKDLMD